MRKDNDSAQMILITGFVIALIIVVLTVMLNSVIYASNTASEANFETNVYDHSNTLKITTQAYQKAYVDNSIDNNYIKNYTRHMARSHALAGNVFKLSNGPLQEPYFTQNGLVCGNPDWIVADRMKGSVNLNLEINTSSLGNETNCFTIKAQNDSAVFWSARIFEDNGTYYINSTEEENILDEFNIVNLTVVGQVSDEQYRIRFLNGDLASGVFTISGEKTNGDLFELRRDYAVNANILFNKRNGLEMNVSIPIILPGRQI